ncbi:MAG: hypothetical protein Q8K36_03695, partial [Alphaproteobacteria bacterium]|nr:hypothetical protein [Alphaproteobacteria bacterium]
VLKTPEFLDRLEATAPIAYSTSFIIHFSTPPGEPRVIGIERQTASQTPPSAADYEAGLIAKYGQPVSRSVTHNLVWEEPEKPRCGRSLNHKKQLEPDVFTKNRNKALQVVESRQRNKANGLPADLTSCGAYHTYLRNGLDPVVRFNAHMYDLGGIVASERRSGAWVAQIKADAIKKRQAGGKVPKL